MKKHRFAKFLLSVLLLGGVFGLSACESASKTATMPTEQCEVKVIEDSQTHDKKAVVTLCVTNNTIYNVKQVSVEYTVYEGTKVLYEGNDPVDLYVRHGVAGYITYSLPIKDKGLQTATSVIITHPEVTDYFSFWDTYVVPFVVMFVVAGIALLFAAIDIFTKQWTKEGLREMLREKLSLYLIIFAMTILICLIPLMFSNWVVTLILVGGFVGVALLTGVMTAIKVAISKK